MQLQHEHLQLQLMQHVELLRLLELQLLEHELSRARATGRSDLPTIETGKEGTTCRCRVNC